MKVVTADQMRALDRRAIDEAGIPGVVLMENAGHAVVSFLERTYGPLQGKRVAVFCGTGNNGGDGFVIARYLSLVGAFPWIALAGGVDRLSGDAAIHYRLAAPLCSEDRGTFFPLTDNRWEQALRLETDLVVDALLGTGSKGAPRDGYAVAIEAINRCGHPIIAVDVPSGVDADTGETPGAAIRAMHTVTFAYPKLGLLMFPGAECVGALHVEDIGFFWERLSVETPYRLFAAPDFDPLRPAKVSFHSSLSSCVETQGPLKFRRAESNKGDYGHVAVVAGSRGMVGAPALVARAAQRAGAGLVTVLAPSSAQPMIAVKLDEQMTLPLPDADGALTEEAFDAIARFAEKATVLCLGPGLTTAPGTVALIQRILVSIAKPIILDADGLNALAMKPDLFRDRGHDVRAPLVITPHPGEAARLLGTTISEVQSNRVSSVIALARRFTAIAVLKGSHTLIADPSGNVLINTSGNAGMATGGSGDTLTGILGGLMAQAVAPGKSIKDEEAYIRSIVPPEQTVATGVYIHGLAGDLAAALHGETGLVAGDLIAHLPEAIRLLEEMS